MKYSLVSCWRKLKVSNTWNEEVYLVLGFRQLDVSSATTRVSYTALIVLNLMLLGLGAAISMGPNSPSTVMVKPPWDLHQVVDELHGDGQCW